MRDVNEPLSVYKTWKLGDDKCWYCGDVLFSGTKTVDHFWPKSMRGRLKVACCAGCNATKKNLTPNDFIDLLNELKTKYPKNAPWQNKFNRAIIATQTLWERVRWSVLDYEITKSSLLNRSDKIKLLEEYSLFLEKNGYMDTDWRVEEPFAIDEFLKEE